jgi:beta-glucoside operon transcriptional antiterminator
MKAIKKINNNVALCVDSNNNELIAFGKGIGFPSMPHEVELSQISMTFYKVNKIFYDLIQEIPAEVLDVSALIVNEARRRLNCELNPNLIVTLADHINFAIIRTKKYKQIKLPFSFEVEKLYPKETEIGRFSVNLVQKKLYSTLPDSEITTIAMHILNAEEDHQLDIDFDLGGLIEEITAKLEEDFAIQIERNSFTYNRFVVHLRYYIGRVKEDVQYTDDNQVLFDGMRENFPEIYESALEISKIIEDKFQTEVISNELFYLMIHINRIINTSK